MSGAPAYGLLAEDRPLSHCVGDGIINRQFTPQGTPEAWRALYYDAIARGRLQLVFAQRMVEVYALQQAGN